MPFCPTCRKIIQWIGKKLIALGVKLAVTKQEPNLIINSYKCSIEDYRETQYKGHIIIYDCTKTTVVANKNSLVLGI